MIKSHTLMNEHAKRQKSYPEGASMPSLPQKKTLATQITVSVKLNYLLSLPKDYDPQQRWPLVLFLHGASERGNNLDQLRCSGPPKRIEEGQDFPFLVVAPQCPQSDLWTSSGKIATLAALIDEIELNYAIDTDCIYLTGLSMGGYGTWRLAAAYPQRFAAIAPICAGNDPATANLYAMRHIPVWAFHGAKDDLVPLRAGQALVDAFKACGGKVQFTIYPDANHDAWTETYANPELYTWLLQHHKTAEPHGESTTPHSA